MSQSQFSQRSLNLDLPDMNLPDNFFANFEEISKKYNDIDIKTDNIAAYENIIKNDSFNDINNIKFHNSINNNYSKNEKNNKNKNNKIGFENAELIFDSPRALKLSGENSRKKELNIDEEKNLFEEYLKSDYYINRNNKNFYVKNGEGAPFQNLEKIEKPNLKEILSKKSWDEDVEFIKENIFNFKRFFPMQREIINSIMMNKDIYAFFLNKEHKAICYQIPAIISNDKIFLVIKSSNDLIQNEINFMEELGIKVLNLTLYEKNMDLNIEKNFCNRNSEDNIKMIYTTPDIIYKNKNIFELLLKLHQKEKLKTIIIDEINLMSKWDKNFRQDYFELINIKNKLEKCSIICFTNTPSVIIRDNVLNLIDIKRKVLYYKLSYNKPNVFFEFKNKKNLEDPMDNILKQIKNNYFENKNGIIYCNTENDCKKLYDFLFVLNKIKCDCIHNGLFEKNQKEIINKWINNEINIIITNIDLIENIQNKKDIRFIIYYNSPKNFDELYTNINIIGLDSEPSKCIVYYDSNEISSIKNSEKNYSIEELRNIEKLIDFCEDNNECRRKLFLSYFNEEFDKNNCYHMCDNCKKNIVVEKIDCTKECKEILGILNKNPNFEYNFEEFCGILNGKNKNEGNFIKEEEFFGLMKNHSLNNIKKIMRYLIIKGYIDEYHLNNNISLKLTNIGENLYNDNKNEIKILLPIGKKLDKKQNISSNSINALQDNKSYNNYRRNYETNIYYRSKGSFKSEYALECTNDYGLCEPTEFDDLLEQLKGIRRDLLKKENIKRKIDSYDGNFIPLELEDIISNEGLKELVRVLPTKDEDLEENNLLKKEKNLDMYKNEILPTISKFITIYNIDVDKRRENRQNNSEINYGNIDIDEEKNSKSEKEEFKIDGYKYDDLFNKKYNIMNEEDNKTFNDRNCLLIGIKRKPTDNNSASCIFNQLANKSKKNKKAKFL